MIFFLLRSCDRLHMHGLCSLSDGITTIYSVFVLRSGRQLLYIDLSDGQNSPITPFDGWAKSRHCRLSDGLNAETRKKAARWVSFLVTIFLVSWKQTQWAAFYIYSISRALVKRSINYASDLSEALAGGHASFGILVLFIII